MSDRAGRGGGGGEGRGKVLHTARQLRSVVSTGAQKGGTQAVHCAEPLLSNFPFPMSSLLLVFYALQGLVWACRCGSCWAGGRVQRTRRGSICVGDHVLQLELLSSQSPTPKGCSLSLFATGLVVGRTRRGDFLRWWELDDPIQTPAHPCPALLSCRGRRGQRTGNTVAQVAQPLRSSYSFCNYTAAYPYPYLVQRASGRPQ